MKPASRGWEAPINVTADELEVLRWISTRQVSDLTDREKATFTSIRDRVIKRIIRTFADADTTEKGWTVPDPVRPVDWPKGSDGLYLRTKPVRVVWDLIDNGWCLVFTCAFCGNGPITGDVNDDNCCDIAPSGPLSVDSGWQAPTEEGEPDESSEVRT